MPGAPDPVELGELLGDFGGGSFKVEIQDESGKISLNIVSEEYLRSLVESVGIGKPDSDIIVDSIMDWRDVDTAHRINGAEDAYYQSLPRPYKTKNGRIESVEELLLVRGVTRDYFYSHREKGSGRRCGQSIRPVPVFYRRITTPTGSTSTRRRSRC